MAATENLKAEVKQALIALELLATGQSIPAFAFEKINFSMKACEIAAAMSGRDLFLCKMLNRKFRALACDHAFESAVAA